MLHEATLAQTAAIAMTWHNLEFNADQDRLSDIIWILGAIWAVRMGGGRTIGEFSQVDASTSTVKIII